jgi:hypothetical protein
VNQETRIGLIVLAAFFTVALAFCIGGLARLIGPALSLKKRAETLRALPILRAGPMAEIYLARINERSAELALTLERLQAALSDLDRATRGLRSTLGTIAAVLVSLRTGLRGPRPHQHGKR